MKAEQAIPDLTFPQVEYGRRQIKWTLLPLLYVGGSHADVREVAEMIDSGILGDPILERLNLVGALHSEITTRLVQGGSQNTAFTSICILRKFFTWVDNHGYKLSIDSVEDVFQEWANFLDYRGRLSTSAKNTPYSQASVVSRLLDSILERSTPLISTTTLRYFSHAKKAAGGVREDKLDLTTTFTFGNFLLDVIDGLPTDIIFGGLPVRIKTRSGATLVHWCKLKPIEKVLAFQPGYAEHHNTRRVKQARRAWEEDGTLRTRHPLVNLRIESELMVFIGQTGMNLSQAHRLELCQFSYKSSIDGYEVRDYKHRRAGEVLFEIFTEYRPIFERYLMWRKTVFAESNELFPLIRSGGRAFMTAPTFRAVRTACIDLGLTFIPPRFLRNTRVNWLLRQSRNPDMTAELAQHTKRMLIEVYDRPSQQVAIAEIVQFWPSWDPAQATQRTACPGPGECNDIPIMRTNAPRGAPKPNCRLPSGCIFCENHKDIDSGDYVWSIASMLYFKTLILRTYPAQQSGAPDPAHQVELVIDALMAKLKWFKNSNDFRRSWVTEAMERTEEDHFHPHWRYLIESAQER